MTELDNASLHLYSMTSKGVNIKKELVKIVGRFFNWRSRNIEDNPSKILILKNINAVSYTHLTLPTIYSV